MHTSQIKKYLKIIGISSISQFEKHDLDYWWKKKYAQIFESNFEDRNELLINLNNAKENLDNIEYEELLNCFKTNSARNKKEIITKKDNIEKKNPKNSTYYSLHPKKSISDINKNDEKKVYKSEASSLLKNLKRSL